MKKEEALQELRGFIGQLTEGCQEVIKVLVPELTESEDERIRKEILEDIRNVKAISSEEYRKKADRWIAWLEKQKEQKPADLIEEEYIENRNDGTYTCATTKDGFDAFMDGFNKGYELGIKEQTQKTITLWQRKKRF